MYLAISTTNPANGWQIYATGDNKAQVEKDAETKIGPILNQWGQSDLKQETLHKNLRVVSKTQARRFFVRPEFLDEEIAKFNAGYYDC